LVAAPLISFLSPEGVNAFGQRFEFFEYALSRFFSNPIGSGIGQMRQVAEGVLVQGAVYEEVTDAYIGIILAEVGAIGFFIFCLSFREIFWDRNPISHGIVFGLFAVMIGTDLGDFGPYYLAIMILGFCISRLQIVEHSKRVTSITEPANIVSS
jgi:hypothetical protein